MRPSFSLRSDATPLPLTIGLFLFHSVVMTLNSDLAGFIDFGEAILTSVPHIRIRLAAIENPQDPLTTFHAYFIIVIVIVIIVVIIIRI